MSNFGKQPILRYNVLTSPQDVRAAFAAAVPLMYIGDDRPYATVLNCLSKYGYGVGLTEAPVPDEKGSIVLVINLGKGPRKEFARKISLPKLLHICIEKSAELTQKGRSSYERMCGEESMEELDMLLQKFYAGSPNLRPSSKAYERNKAAFSVEAPVPEVDIVPNRQRQNSPGTPLSKKDMDNVPLWMLC